MKLFSGPSSKSRKSSLKSLSVWSLLGAAAWSSNGRPTSGVATPKIRMSRMEMVSKITLEWVSRYHSTPRWTNSKRFSNSAVDRRVSLVPYFDTTANSVSNANVIIRSVCPVPHLCTPAYREQPLCHLRRGRRQPRRPVPNSSGRLAAVAVEGSRHAVHLYYFQAGDCPGR